MTALSFYYNKGSWVLGEEKMNIFLLPQWRIVFSSWMWVLGSSSKLSASVDDGLEDMMLTYMPHISLIVLINIHEGAVLIHVWLKHIPWWGYLWPSEHLRVFSMPSFNFQISGCGLHWTDGWCRMTHLFWEFMTHHQDPVHS